MDSYNFNGISGCLSSLIFTLYMLSVDAKHEIVAQIFRNSTAAKYLQLSSCGRPEQQSNGQNSNQMHQRNCQPTSKCLVLFWECSKTIRDLLPMARPPTVSPSTCLPEGYEWWSWWLVSANCSSSDGYYGSQNVTKWRTGMRQIIKWNELELGNE